MSAKYDKPSSDTRVRAFYSNSFMSLDEVEKEILTRPDDIEDPLYLSIKFLFQEKMKSDYGFCKDIWSALANVTWTNDMVSGSYGTSFRGAGRWISKIIDQGFYLDWYMCQEHSVVSDEIRQALGSLDWSYNITAI